MKNNKLSLATLGFAVLISCRAQEIKPDDKILESPSSVEVLSKVNETYKNLISYQDEGVSVTKFERSTPGHTNELHFTTAYANSGKFRFEFWESGIVSGETRMVVWKDGKSVKSWWTVDPKVELHEDIGSAISGATGVSGGTAYFVPPILMKKAAWKKCTWTCSDGTYRVKDGLEAGTPCFRIQRLTSTKAEKINGMDTPGTKGKETYWISKDNFLLLRVDEESDFGSFSTKQTIKYFPQINSVIPNGALEFKH